MAKKYHPDRHQALDAEEKKKMEKMFQDCAEAYEVLSDEEKKGKYDRGEDVFENQGHQHHQHNFHRTGGFHFGFGF
ncbi:hypothetical protein BASA81_001622 [Batrachochytrium salamandrivorans]|nr:hypothetical protein BASA81_001622 [Batrachochytrium salamandrivorans]